FRHRNDQGSSMKRLLPLVVLALAACGTPPAVAPPPKPIDLPPPPAPPAPPAARWTESVGATFVGPEVDGGTLVVLGGRRALVAKDGAVTAETAPSPEPIEEIIEVPSKSGARKLVARTTHGVVRLDDPLGAPAPIAHAERVINKLGSAPGVVAIWGSDSDL